MLIHYHTEIPAADQPPEEAQVLELPVVQQRVMPFAAPANLIGIADCRLDFIQVRDRLWMPALHMLPDIAVQLPEVPFVVANVLRKLR